MSQYLNDEDISDNCTRVVINYKLVFFYNRQETTFVINTAGLKNHVLK